MTMESTAGQRHRVVVVGGGFGGLNAVRELADADVDVTFVDRTNHHLFQPLLYQVAAGILSPGLIAPALRSILKNQPNARALLADVNDLDLDAKVVRATGPDGRPLDLPYDTLVVAAGRHPLLLRQGRVRRVRPGHEDDRGRPVHPRRASCRSSRWPRMAADPAERAEWLTFVVIGAGPTGVELVGQIAELAHTVLPHDYRSVNTTEARIILLEGAPSVLPPFDKKLQDYTQQRLEKMGVEVRTQHPRHRHGPRVDHRQGPGRERDHPGPHPDLGRRRAGLAAGQDAGRRRPVLETDRAGRVPVNPDCSLPGTPRCSRSATWCR